MDIKVWLLYLFTEFLLAITPGPAVMLVSSQGFRYGAISSYFGALGISSGNFLYFILSSLGLATLILAAGNLFEYIKIAGAVYLIITGFIMIYKSFIKKQAIQITDTSNQDSIKSYIQGFVTQAVNPKAIIFFVALLPQFIDKSKSIGLQFSILALTTIIMETLILMFYGWISASGKSKIGKSRIVSQWQDRFAGSILIGLGINLVRMKAN